MLKQRLLNTLIWFAVIVLALRYQWIFALCIMGLIAGGLYEFFCLIEKKGIPIYKYFGMAIGVIIPLSILFEFELTRGWELLFIFLALVSLFILQFKRRDNSQAIVGISTTLFGILYVAWFLSFLIKIRNLPAGAGYLAAVILVTKSSDIGAYVIGSGFGRHALIPRISPKKSIEGALGGLLFSVIAAVLSKPFLGFSYPRLIILGIAIGILAELGDLSESLIKRDCQVKDSGSFFPGMGGVLDLVDSLLFTAPVFYFYMSNVLR
ncbi:phosphatidate cytidylyltransferase [bacterium]|nr:MAG: phosphatidate cytidylyltransferase [bacterium]